jgi:hypothetical protein
VQKRAAKFANNINELGCETFAKRGLITRICVLFKAHTGGRVWKAIGDSETKENGGKCSFVNRAIKSWNQVPSALPASFTCKFSTFRKRVKNGVTSKGIQVGIDCNEKK